jgi:hypothetical protein
MLMAGGRTAACGASQNLMADEEAMRRAGLAPTQTYRLRRALEEAGW